MQYFLYLEFEGKGNSRNNFETIFITLGLTKVISCWIVSANWFFSNVFLLFTIALAGSFISPWCFVFPLYCVINWPYAVVLLCFYYVSIFDYWNNFMSIKNLFKYLTKLETAICISRDISSVYILASSQILINVQL